MDEKSAINRFLTAWWYRCDGLTFCLEPSTADGVAMFEPAAQDPEDAIALAETRGKPQYDRRLADKVLAAFNHAYAVGAHDVARGLRDVLATVEAQDPFTLQRRQGHQ